MKSGFTFARRDTQVGQQRAPVVGCRPGKGASCWEKLECCKSLRCVEAASLPGDAAHLLSTLATLLGDQRSFLKEVCGSFGCQLYVMSSGVPKSVVWARHSWSGLGQLIYLRTSVLSCLQP